jgi:hypothetical protein
MASGSQVVPLAPLPPSSKEIMVFMDDFKEEIP